MMTYMIFYLCGVPNELNLSDFEIVSKQNIVYVIIFNTLFCLYMFKKTPSRVHPLSSIWGRDGQFVWLISWNPLQHTVLETDLCPRCDLITNIVF